MARDLGLPLLFKKRIRVRQAQPEGGAGDSDLRHLALYSFVFRYFLPDVSIRLELTLGNDYGDYVQCFGVLGEFTVECQKFATMGGACQMESIREIHAAFHPVYG